MHHKSSAQHANGTHVGHPRSQDKHVLAEQTHQEGFIDTDPSPAVLKTEFPPKLEPHLEQPHKAQPDNLDGENAGVAVFDQLLTQIGCLHCQPRHGCQYCAEQPVRSAHSQLLLHCSTALCGGPGMPCQW